MYLNVQRHDFFAVLSLKRGGWLDSPFPCAEALDRMVAKMLGLSRKACQRLKQKLMELSLVTESWQPQGWQAWQSGNGHKRHNGHGVRDIIDAHKERDERRERAAQANRERVRRSCQRQQQDGQSPAPVPAHSGEVTITDTITDTITQEKNSVAQN